MKGRREARRNHAAQGSTVIRSRVLLSVFLLFGASAAAGANNSGARIERLAVTAGGGVASQPNGGVLFLSVTYGRAPGEAANSWGSRLTLGFPDPLAVFPIPSATPTPAQIPSPSPTTTPAVTATPGQIPTPTPTQPAEATPSPSPTDSTATPQSTATVAPTETPTATPALTASPTGTPSATPEPARSLIESFYRLVLGREPEEGAVDAWYAGYFEYALSFNIDVRFIPREMARLFFLSEEYENRRRANGEFIADCYGVFLDRRPTELELANWLGGTWNRPEVTTIFAESEEFAARIEAMYPRLGGDPARNFVTSMYIGLLDRLVDRQGLEYAAMVFGAANAAGGVEGVRSQAKQMAREIFASEEFRNLLISSFTSQDAPLAPARSGDPAIRHPLSAIHSTYVTRLYRAFLGRFPSDHERAH